MTFPKEKAENIYCSALEIQSPGSRQAFVEQACQGDVRLRALVEQWLAGQGGAERFFPEGGLVRLPLEALSQSVPGPLDSAKPGNASAGLGEVVGQNIGPYQLLERIGEGGCGTVYLAGQEKPVRRRVALKIIKLGMDTKAVIARFEAERLALALMDHPSIARVLDAGATDSGRPYFVMELVQGVKITDYCDQNALNLRQRLKLFIRVCQAIQHAHQKGVIHRDIKPSNILVTMIDGEPVPKVIDFGIAKAIAGRLTDSTVVTACELLMGTPAYMSPEQVVMSGVDVDTRSDIYSLGVLLYELLAGRTPFVVKELLQGGLEGLRQTLRDTEPQRPSVAVASLPPAALSQLAQRRQAEPPRLIAQLQGDLDWIVIRALEKDRARRYETAHGLAMDVQRFLDNEPVVARPPSRWYRLRKLVLRNKAVFVAEAMVALTLLGGLTLSTWLWHQEREVSKRAVLAEHQALAAERQQTRLRLEAETRERITRASFLALRGKLAAADEIMEKMPALQPSLDGEAALRALLEWHAIKGQWNHAATRPELLLQADQDDNSWVITTDLLIVGPVLIEGGNLAGYERFRLAAIARFAGTTNAIDAERTIKISLLLPADAALVKSLEPFYAVSTNSMDVPGQDPVMTAWRCISLSLMACRQGDAPAARAWCQRCLAYPEYNPARIATAHLIQSLVCHQQGETEAARSELAQGRKLVEDTFAAGLQSGVGQTGYWFDWLFARILLREAETQAAKT